MLIEVGIPLDELHAVLAAQGMTIVSNHKTKRARLVRIPRLIQTGDLAQDAEHAVEHLPRRDNRVVEPLHHHAHPRVRGRADFNTKQRRTKA